MSSRVYRFTKAEMTRLTQFVKDNPCSSYKLVVNDEGYTVDKTIVMTSDIKNGQECGVYLELNDQIPF